MVLMGRCRATEYFSTSKKLGHFHYVDKFSCSFLTWGHRKSVEKVHAFILIVGENASLQCLPMINRRVVPPNENTSGQGEGGG